MPLQFGLQFPEIGVQVDPDMGGAKQIVFEARQGDLAGEDAAPHPVVALGNQDLQALFGQQRGADQGVVPAAGNGYIAVRHGRPLCPTNATGCRLPSG